MQKFPTNRRMTSRIKRAVKNVENMSLHERLGLMLKAKLISPEQFEEATKQASEAIVPQPANT